MEQINAIGDLFPHLPSDFRVIKPSLLRASQWLLRVAVSTGERNTLAKRLGWLIGALNGIARGFFPTQHWVLH
jgi:hypothetical protein